MSRRGIRLFCCALAAVAFQARTVQAAWPIKHPHHHDKPVRSVLVPPAKPCYGFSTPPPYNWGWFGTQYTSLKFFQHSFNNHDHIDSSYWQGYW